MALRGWRCDVSAFCILPSAFRRQVNLRFALIDQGDVRFDKEIEAGELTALQETRLGLHRLGDSDPDVALRLGERAPTFGDRAKTAADSDLTRRSGVKRDEGWIAVLAKAIALPDRVPAFAGLRNVEGFHHCDTGAA